MISKHKIALFLILMVGVYVRLKTCSSEHLQTLADPWWFYRHLKEVVENGGIPKWDHLSHYPGRPFEWWLFYVPPYIIYLILTNFGLDLMTISNYIPVIFMFFSGIIAYLLGNLLAKNFDKRVQEITGILLASFILFSPSIVIVSSCGYFDSDFAVITYSLLAFYSLLLLISKESVRNYAFAVFSNILFIGSWVSGWYVLLLFGMHSISLAIFYFYKKRSDDARRCIKSYGIVFASCAIISMILGFNIFFFIYERIFVSTKMLVNISVAELRKTSIASQELIGRIGPIIYYTSILIPFYFLVKFLKKRYDKIDWLFTIYYVFILYMLSEGVRFTLIFSIGAAIIISYIFSQVLNYKKAFSIAITFLIFLEILRAPLYIVADVPPNTWKEAMNFIKNDSRGDEIVVTYWDPGHYISAMTGLPNYFDGAHCSYLFCKARMENGKFSDHNERIKLIARIFITDNETEAIELLKKGLNLNVEDIKREFGMNITYQIPKRIYFLSSSDLILKFQWLAYYGSMDDEKYFFKPSSMEELIYNPGWCIVTRDAIVYCPWIYTREGIDRWAGGGYPSHIEKIKIEEKEYLFLTFFVDEKTKDLLFFNNVYRQGVLYNYTDVDIKIGGYSIPNEKRLDGILYDFGNLKIYFPKQIARCILVRTLFTGELEHFKHLYSNGDVSIFEVNLQSNS